MKKEANSTRQAVEHHYRDFASETQRASIRQTDAQAVGPGGDPPFPVKLHHVLTELKQDGMDHIISWQPHGR